MPTDATVTGQTGDGPLNLYEARPDGAARGGVVVVQEAFGLTSHIQDVTHRFATAGYHAVAPELFHRAGGGTVPYGSALEELLPKFAHLTDEGILADVDVALDHLRSAGFGNARIGTVGFCFGGRATFLVARNRALGAAVGFYGGGIVRPGRFPGFNPLVDQAGSLQTPWLGLFGDEDASIPVEDVERLRAELDAHAPVAHEIVRYPGAGHGFHCDQRDDYVESAAQDAWARTLAWLDAHLA